MWVQLKRLFKHRWLADGAARRALPPSTLERLAQAVRHSETQHSGEIRIFVEAGLPLSYLWRDAPLPHIIRQRALSQFGKLRVWDTEHNNGVLIYLLQAEHAIEIVADRGLNDKVSAATWQHLLSGMRAHFQRGEFETGLTQTVAAVSGLLQAHFPLAPDAHNPNELPDMPTLR
ncbi:TPM domain-containing protein [Rhodoferax fermentans]|uniref:TPM domain-containing protein n=1 Tax=Rhodoferax fermentans TaxID=28066 RepID=A0A1T1ATF3_RHOFE|nr:TPM domain-containing protein [Rhodoferax fermentans]MBK1685064.1 hypothetical protein [Rhodoferax fermentans]OOV07386.1 hypothetical protein RF819_12160 [Rhodoferax fermentans]